jgi:hypothetical protein
MHNEHHHHGHVHTADAAEGRDTVLTHKPNGHDDSTDAVKAVDLSALDHQMHSGMTDVYFTLLAVL